MVYALSSGSVYHFCLSLFLTFHLFHYRNLQSNGLSGRMPSELGNLKDLEELRLDRNKLQGTVPGNNGSRVASNMHGM